MQKIMKERFFSPLPKIILILTFRLATLVELAKRLVFFPWQKYKNHYNIVK